VLAIAVLALVPATACGDPGGGGATGDGGASGDGAGLSGELTVSAAASLGDAFTAIGDEFAGAHPGVSVRFNFDSSTALERQVREGAPVDVFAAADRDNMAAIEQDGLLAGEPEVFARTRMVIVTEPGNPRGIEALGDLADLGGAGVVSLCAPDAPCGRYADVVLGLAGASVPEDEVTRGQNATATLTAVSEGDAVAGIVYATDARRAGDAVDTVPVPDTQNVAVLYPIGVLADAATPDAARAFVDTVLGESGQRILASFGFEAPS
jgi:molybdate transport system substrate-binding protein